MAFRRRNNRRRRPNKRRNFKSKWARKQMIKPKFGGKIKQPVHYFTRFVDKGTISGDGTGTASFGVVSFTLSEVPGFGEFVNLYDYFKLNAVKVSFIPVSNVSVYSAMGSGSIPLGANTTYYDRFFSVVDYNDATVPTSIDSLREYSNCKWSPNNKIHKRFLHPKVILSVDDASAGSPVELGQFNKNPWLSTASNGAVFYGIKYAFEQFTNNSDVRYRIECKFYMSFKAPR